MCYIHVLSLWLELKVIAAVDMNSKYWAQVLHVSCKAFHFIVQFVF